MPAETTVTELLNFIQGELSGSAGEDLSSKEQRVPAIGRVAAELSLAEMLESDGDEPVSVACECGGTAKSKEREGRTVVTLAVPHGIRRRK